MQPSRPSARPRRQHLAQLHVFLAALIFLGRCSIASLDFPLPASSAVCPSFARYRYLHRTALGQRTHIPGWGYRHSRFAAAAGAASDGLGTAHATGRLPRHHDLSASVPRRSGRSLAASELIPSSTSAEGVLATPSRPRTRWVVTADPDGIADRLVNAVSSFYFALLTDRVLCIQPAHKDQPGLEAAFAAPNIDWTCGLGGLPADTDPAAMAPRGDGTFGPPLTGPDVAFWDPTEDDAWLDPSFPVYHTFVRSDLRTVGPSNATTILLRMHRGISVGLFSNPHHRRQLEALGLRPDTAFGCAVAFLFGPNAETRALAEADPALHRVMVDEDAIKIGIQIRLGDQNILAQLEQKGETALDDKSRSVVDGYLGCADDLAASLQELSGPTWPHAAQRDEEEAADAPSAPPPAPPAPPPPYAGPPLRVYFYLMTDTLAVRRMAAERFGDRLLALPAATVQFYQNVTADGLRSTVLEHWYFSRCHHHVITGHSGMGRTAAFASLRPGPSLFSMEVADGSRFSGRGCAVPDADRPVDVYNTWSGV